VAKREKKPEPIDFPKDGGAALFLELMMQMLAFFILLTSMAVIVDEKRIAALGSLAGTFSPLPKGANLTDGKGPSLPAKSITEGTKAPKRTSKALSEAAKKLGQDDKINVIDLGSSKIRVILPQTITFKEGGYKINKASLDFISETINLLRLPDVTKIKIDGYADFKYTKDDWRLSTRRSISFFKLLKNNNIPAHKIIISGNGSNNPIITDGRIDLEKSRRIELTIEFRPTDNKPSGQFNLDGQSTTGKAATSSR